MGTVLSEILSNPNVNWPVDIDYQNNAGYTALHYAALRGHEDLVELLISYGANPNIENNDSKIALNLLDWTAWGDAKETRLMTSVNAMLTAGRSNES